MNNEMSARTKFRPWEHRKLDNSLLQQVVATSSINDTASGTEENTTSCECKQSVIRSYQKCSSERKMYSLTTSCYFTCLVCGKQYGSKSNLKRHIKNLHFLEDEELDRVYHDSLNCNSSNKAAVSRESSDDQHITRNIFLETSKHSSSSKVSVNAKSVELPSHDKVTEQVSKKCVVKLQNIAGDNIIALDKSKSPVSSKSQKIIPTHKHEKSTESKGKNSTGKANKGSANKKSVTIKRKPVSTRSGSKKLSSTDKKEKLRKIYGNKAVKGKVYKRTLKSQHKVMRNMKIQKNSKKMAGCFQPIENKQCLRSKANLVVDEVKRTLLESKFKMPSERSKSGNPPAINLRKEKSKSGSPGQAGSAKGTKTQSAALSKTNRIGESLGGKNNVTSKSKMKTKAATKSKQNIQNSHRKNHVNKNVISSDKKDSENIRPSKIDNKSPIKSGRNRMENVVNIAQNNSNISVVSLNEVRSKVNKSMSRGKEDQELSSATGLKKFGKTGIVSQGEYNVKVVDFRSRSREKSQKRINVNADLTVDETGDTIDEAGAKDQNRSPFRQSDSILVGDDTVKVMDFQSKPRGRQRRRTDINSDIAIGETGDVNDEVGSGSRSMSPFKNCDAAKVDDTEKVPVIDVKSRPRSRPKKQNNIDPDMTVDKTGDAKFAVGSRTRSKSPKKVPKTKIQPENIEGEEKVPDDVPPPLYSVGLQRANNSADTQQENVVLSSNSISIQSSSVLEVLPNVSCDNLQVNWTNLVSEGAAVRNTSNTTAIDRTLFNLFTPESMEWELPQWTKQKPDTEIDFKSVKLKITKDFQSQSRLVRSVIPCSNIMDIQLKITRDFSKTKRTVVPKTSSVTKLITNVCSDKFEQKVGNNSQVNVCITDRKAASASNTDTDTMMASSCSADKVYESMADKPTTNSCPVKVASDTSSDASDQVTSLVLDDNCNLISDTSNKSTAETKIQEEEMDIVGTPFHSKIVTSSELLVDDKAGSVSQGTLLLTDETLKRLPKDNESKTVAMETQEELKVGKKFKNACDRVGKSAMDNKSLEKGLGKVTDIFDAKETSFVNNAEVSNEDKTHREKDNVFKSVPNDKICERNETCSHQQNVVDSCIEGMAKTDLPLHDDTACSGGVDASSVVTVGSSEDNMCRKEEASKETAIDSSLAASRLETESCEELVNSDNCAIGVEIVSSTTLLSESNVGKFDNKDYFDKDGQLMQKEESQTSTFAGSAVEEMDDSSDTLSSGEVLINNSVEATDGNKNKDQLKEVENSDKTDRSDHKTNAQNEKSSVSFNDKVESLQEFNVLSQTVDKNLDTNMRVISKEVQKSSDVTNSSMNDLLPLPAEKPGNDTELEEDNSEDTYQKKMRLNEMNVTESQYSRKTCEKSDGSKMKEGRAMNRSEISVNGNKKPIGELTSPVNVAELANDMTDALPKNKRRKTLVKRKQVENSYDELDELDGLTPCHANSLFLSELEKGNFESCLQCLQSEGLTKLIDLDNLSEDQLRKIVDMHLADEEMEDSETEIDISVDENMASVTVKPVNGKFKHDQRYINKALHDLFQMFDAVDSDQMEDALLVSDCRDNNVTDSNQKEDALLSMDHRESNVTDSNQMEDTLLVTDHRESNVTDSNQMEDTLLVMDQRESNVTDSNQMEDTLLVSDHREDNVAGPEHKTDCVMNSGRRKRKNIKFTPALQSSGESQSRQNKKCAMTPTKSALTSSPFSECLKDSTTATDYEKSLEFTTNDTRSQADDEMTGSESACETAAVLTVSDVFEKKTNFLYVCKLCGNKYKYKKGLQRHSKNKHADAKDINELVIEVVNATKRKYMVQKVPEKEMLSLVNKDQNPAIPVGVAVDKAQEIVNSSPKTATHQKNIKNTVYVCSICNNEYKQSSNLQHHIQTCHPECENVVLKETETLHSLSSSLPKPELVVSANQVEDLKKFFSESDKQGDEFSPAHHLPESNELQDGRADEKIRAEIFRNTGVNISDTAFVKIEKFPLLEKEVHVEDMVLTQQGSGRSSYWNVKCKAGTETRNLELNAMENVNQNIVNEGHNTTVDNDGNALLGSDVEVITNKQNFDIGINITFNHTDQLDLRDNVAKEKTSDTGNKNGSEAFNPDVVVSSDRKKIKHKVEQKSKKRKREESEEPTTMTDFEMAISAPRTDIRKSKKKRLERQNSSTSLCETVVKPVKSQLDPETSNEPSSKIVKNILRKKGLEKKGEEIPVMEKPAPFEEILAQNTTKKVPSAKPPMSNSQKKTTAVYQNMLVTQPAIFNRSFKKVQQDSNNSADKRDLWRSPLANTGQDVDLKFGSSLSKSLDSGSEVNASTEKTSTSVGNSKNYLLEIMKDIPSIHDTSTNKFVSPFDNPLVSPKSGTKHSGFAIPNQFKSHLKWNLEETVSKSVSKELLKMSSGKPDEVNPQDIISSMTKEKVVRKVDFESNSLVMQDTSSTKSKLDFKSNLSHNSDKEEKILKELESDDYLDYNEDLTLTDEDEGDDQVKMSGKNTIVKDSENTDIATCNSQNMHRNVDFQSHSNKEESVFSRTADKVTHSLERNDENLRTVEETGTTAVNSDNSIIDFDVSNAKVLPDGIHCVMSDEELRESFNSLAETEGIQVTENMATGNIEGTNEAAVAHDEEDCQDDDMEEDERSEEADDELSEGESGKEEGVEEINLSEFDDDEQNERVSVKEEESDDDKEDSDDDKADTSTDINCAASVISKTSRVFKKTTYGADDDALSIFVDSDEQISLCGDLDEEDVLNDVEVDHNNSRDVLSDIDQDKMSETGTECNQAVDMDLVDVNSLVNTNIQCDLKIQSCQKVPEILMPIPPFCNDYLLHGICKKISCGFKHTGHPDQNQRLKSGVHKIADAFLQRNKIKAFEIYNTLKQHNYGTIQAKTLNNLLCMAVDVGAVDSAFQLLGDLSKQKVLDSNKASVIIRMCGHRPYTYVEQLWSLFECIEASYIEPEQDAVEILLRAFLVAKQWQKLWNILQYFNSMVGLVIPRVIVESAISVCVKNPALYLNSVTQWISTGGITILFQLDKKIIVELLDVCYQNGCHDLAAMLKRYVSDPLSERVENENINEYDWNQENAMQVQNMEGYKSELHRLSGCKLTRNWEYLGSVFVDLCRSHEFTNQNFLKVYCGVLFNTKKPEVMAADFRQFVDSVYKCYDEEAQGDVLIQLDRPALARIGAMLLLQCYEENYWEFGYNLITVMHQLGVLYYKCQRVDNKDTVLIAVEVCINNRQAESALQIFDRSQWFQTAQNNMGYAVCLLQKIANILLEKQHTHKALQVLGNMVAMSSFCNDQEINSEEMCWLFKNLINISCKIGDPRSALAAFQLHKRVNNVGLDVIQLRLLLKCCAEQGWFQHAQEFCEMCIKLGAYPAQNIECEPRCIFLSSEMTSVEHYLLISYYLDGLYNVLCDQVLAGYGIGEKDYLLAICVLRQADGVNGQFQAANTNNLVCKGVVDILKRDITPPLEGRYDNVNIIHIDPATLKKHMDDRDANGRRQGLHVTVGPGAPRVRRNMKGRVWARKRPFRR